MLLERCVDRDMLLVEHKQSLLSMKVAESPHLQLPGG